MRVVHTTTCRPQQYLRIGANTYEKNLKPHHVYADFLRFLRGHTIRYETKYYAKHSSSTRHKNPSLIRVAIRGREPLHYRVGIINDYERRYNKC